MKKAGYTGLLLLLVVVSYLLGNNLNRAVVVARAESEESGARRTGARWEYAAVSRSGYTGAARGGNYWISYFKETGVEIVEIEERVSDQQGTQTARAVAKLGEEGWEMVGQGELPVKTGRFEAIYFKRLKQ